MTDRRAIAIRLPSDLKEWIECEASANGSSQNSEVIRAIRERMERLTQPVTA